MEEPWPRGRKVGRLLSFLLCEMRGEGTLGCFFLIKNVETVSTCVWSLQNIRNIGDELLVPSLLQENIKETQIIDHPYVHLLLTWMLFFCVVYSSYQLAIFLVPV